MIDAAVLHVGMPHSGGVFIRRVLSAAGARLLRHGAMFIAADQITAAGAAHADPPRDDLPTRVRAAKVGPIGRRCRTLIVSGDALLGPEDIGPSDAALFRPRAEETLELVAAALPDTPLHVVLYTRRQDHLMERAYVQALAEGRVRDFEEQFPYWKEPVLDYGGLARRLRGVPGVHSVTAWPYEIAQDRPIELLDLLLRVAGVRLRGRIRPRRSSERARVLTAQGRQLARAMNEHVDDDEEQRTLTHFLLAHFGTTDERESRVLDAAQREGVLAAYNLLNRQFLAANVPDVPSTSYADDAATNELARPPMAYARRVRVTEWWRGAVTSRRAGS